MMPEKLWKDSATLIVLGKNIDQTNQQVSSNPNLTDYKVLVFRRPETASFAANAIVFPGGVCEPSDDSQQWIDFYKNEMEISNEKLSEITKITGRREYIFKTLPTDEIAREISLRITAIRETFEELGLIFCKTKEQFRNDMKFSSVYEEFQNEADIVDWQSAVHNDSRKFFEMCKLHSIAPDLWNSYEWASWITPVTVPKRYDTAFFLVTLPNQPKVYPESVEVAEYMWESPENLIEMHKSKKITIPAPQFYEISRLASIKQIEKMMEFVKQRNTLGITTFFPVNYILSDGLTGVYAGDDFYPTHLDHSNPIPEFFDYGNLTLDEFRAKAKNVHRTEHRDTGTWRVTDIFINITPLNGHLRPTTTNKIVTEMNVPKQLWKNSATLIILGKNCKSELKTSKYNYKVLVLKRSAKSSFMPNSIVFPGGVTEIADASRDWIDLYKSLGVINSKFSELTAVQQEQRPFIFQKSNSDQLDRETSLRITAVRETFEELGILISKNSFNNNDLYSSVSGMKNAKQSQKEVHEDPSTFLRLCQTLNVAPDVWSLFEWSDWLTPLFETKRFETAFFIVALKDQPEILAEKTEVQEYMWKSPDTLLEMYNKKEIWLPPPQFYELSKLKCFTNINDVVEFAQKRNRLGMTTIFPVQYRTANGFALIYPGDDFYPKIPDYEKQHPDLDKYEMNTLDEFRKLAKNVHRVEFTSRFDMKFYMNISTGLNGHLNPLLFDKNNNNNFDDESSKSKL